MGLVMTSSTMGTTTPEAVSVASTGPRSTRAVRSVLRRTDGDTKDRAATAITRTAMRAMAPRVT